MITVDQLAHAWSIPLEKASTLAEALRPALLQFNINTPARIAMFLANVGHESGRGKYQREIWGPTRAQLSYQGRMGNLRPGDGRKYMGRGLMQLTGATNYLHFREAMRALLGAGTPDFVQSPELVESPKWSAFAAGWYWSTNNLNRFADCDDFDGCCDAINIGHKTMRIGDANGYQERLELWIDTKRALEDFA